MGEVEIRPRESPDGHHMEQPRQQRRGRCAGEDSRPQVAKAVVQAGYELLELRPVGLSLEEIFLELTRDNTMERLSS